MSFDGFPILRGDIVPADAASFRVKVKLASFIRDPSKVAIANDAVDPGQLSGLPLKLGFAADAAVVGSVVDGGVHMGTVWAELELPRPDSTNAVLLNLWNSIRINGHGAYEFAPSLQVVRQERDEKHAIDVIHKVRVLAVALGATPMIDGKPIKVGLADEAAGPIGIHDPHVLEAIDHNQDGRQPADPDVSPLAAAETTGLPILVDPDGKQVAVPDEAVEALLAAGWIRPPEPWRPGAFG